MLTDLKVLSKKNNIKELFKLLTLFLNVLRLKTNKKGRFSAFFFFY
jgi:IS4 transposase